LENKETLVYLDLRVQEDTEVQQDPQDNLESLDLQVQEAHREKLEILVPLVNKERLENLEEEDQEDQQVNLVILELKVYLVWKADLDLQVHLVPPDLLETPYLLLLLPWEEVRLCQEFLELLDPWDHLDLLVKEEQMETEDLKEEEEYLEWQDHLELLADKVCLEDQEILVNLVNLDVQEDHTLKMILERFVLLFSEIALVS